ncbi:MAG TPA: LuxR C-terminal-related transcriptional regulator [Acidimicrobiales bacterium]
MSAGAAADLVASAEEALASGDYAGALAVATAAVSADPGDGAAHALLGELHYLDDRFPETVAEWQAAFPLLRDAGALRPAAQIAIELARLHGADLGHPAAARGWVERARRLLDRVGPCPEQGHLELAIMACDRADVDDLLASAERALSVALEHGDSGLEALALADSGLALVSQGRCAEGFARLDAALAAISAGEVPMPAAGICFCSMLTACDRAGDVRRAEEWTGLLTDLLTMAGGRPRVLGVHCRLAYGSVLCASGRWPEAEALLVEALGPAQAPTVAHRALTVAHLADLRLDQGRVEEAADLLAPFEDWVTTCGPLARVHLRRGDLDLAAAVLRRGLGELVGDALRAGPLLSTLVEVELARGDVAAARAAAAELDTLAAAVELVALRAEAALASGRVLAAEGDAGGALAAFGRAKAALAGDERPLALGLVRLDLARTLEAGGDRAGAVAEARAALAAFDRLGATTARDRVSALLRGWGDTGRPRPADAAALAATLTRREQEVLDLVAEGLTNAQIARRLYISPKTAEHHVGRVLAKMGVRTRAEAAALAVRLAAVPGGK